jgi:hypothetical protein
MRMYLRSWVERLGPYPSLFLLVVPVCTVEPLKLVAVAGEGHWLTGVAMIIVCYAVSLFVVERLFVIIKPKLLTLPWLAQLWEWLVSVRLRVIIPILKLIDRCRPNRGARLT